jgi:hypothetical protein
MIKKENNLKKVGYTQINELDLIGLTSIRFYIMIYVAVLFPPNSMRAFGLIDFDVWVIFIGCTVVAYVIYNVLQRSFHCEIFTTVDGDHLLRITKEKTLFAFFHNPNHVFLELKNVNIVLLKDKNRVSVILSDSKQKVVIAKTGGNRENIIQHNIRTLAQKLGMGK